MSFSLNDTINSSPKKDFNKEELLKTEHFDSPTSGILSNSKKIKKVKQSVTKKKQKSILFANEDGKKYATVDSKTKKIVLFELKKGIISLKNLTGTPDDLSNRELQELLEGLELSSYNKVLCDVLAKNFPKFDDTTKTLTQWRRKIKSWINSVDKPENRGGILVPFHLLQTFRDRVISLLKSMKARNFPFLRNKIIEIVHDLHSHDAKKQGKEFNFHTCSKHWWFNFMKRNPDIKQLWESMPLERTIPKSQEALDVKFKANSSTSPNDSSQSQSSEPKIKIECLDEEISKMEEIKPEKEKKDEMDTKPLKDTKIEEKTPAKSERIEIIKPTMVIEKPPKSEETPKAERIGLSFQPFVKSDDSSASKSDSKITIKTPLVIQPVQPSNAPSSHLENLLRQRRLLDLMIIQAIHEETLQKKAANVDNLEEN